ncbi:helix-turn-helix domain-containing protein [Ruminiclostridium cellulolyticum]|uniref:Helix-turn-helix domain protein n=1 Tax=Ruminiclostridium cellulolyticum (strain ATCC 35319 / DSM 5812 / JCM 6584 / H10) TaxID=394503 RepID=B8I936_RUMCH|nr:helix-turn-helix transcriptional regulator [Ruminiclostridium cellulolyticum]ACL77368.1 helix-turn-helix domain protein [Ruminiclostridium cellulolyticum H10]
METLYDRIQKLCKENGTNIAALERACGLGNATIKKWSNSTPSGDKLSKVADYFNVTTDYLLGRDNNSKELSPTAKKLVVLARRAEEIPKEQRDELIKYFENTIDIYLKAKGLNKED